MCLQTGNSDVDVPLKDYPFDPHYLTINGYRTHYIDEGSPENKPVLLLHGVPTWSYLFRKMIPPLANAGYRVIAPDMIGFGKSEIPQTDVEYTLDNLTAWLVAFIDQLKMKDVLMFGHDWGAIMGLQLAIAKSSPLSKLVLCNGYIPRTEVRIPFVFRLWKAFTKYSPFIPVGRLVDAFCDRKLSRSERKAYDSPFRKGRDKLAIRKLPQLIPFAHSTCHKLWEDLEKLQLPLITLFSERDPVTRGGEKVIKKHIPGARHNTHKLLKGGHFLPEDAFEEITRLLVELNA